MGHFASYYKSKLSYVPFVTTDIAGCQLWLDAGQGITLNGSNVSQWADMSGNNNHAIQNTASAQPLFVADGGVDINNNPAVSFNGINQFLEFAPGLLGGFNEISVYGVWNITTKHSGIFGTSDYIQFEILSYTVSENSWLSIRVDDQGVNKEIIKTGWWDNNVWNTSAVCASSTVDLTKNGNILTPNIGYETEFPLKSGEIYNIGRYAWLKYSLYASMKITEFIIYSAKNNSTDRQKIESYLKAKYNHY